MKIVIILSALFGLSFGFFGDVKCYQQSQSYVLMAGDTTILNWPGFQYRSLFACLTDAYSCGSTRFEGSITKSYKRWFTDEVVNQTFSYYSERKTCVLDSVCELFAGIII